MKILGRDCGCSGRAKKVMAHAKKRNIPVMGPVKRHLEKTAGVLFEDIDPKRVLMGPSSKKGPRGDHAD